MTLPRSGEPAPLAFEEARRRVLDAVRPLPVERVALAEALGRPLSEAVVSDVDVAPFDNSAMDGYALRAGDVAGAGADAPAELAVVDDIPAGAVPSAPVAAGQAARIMTGAPVPEGADAVVMVEDTEPGERGGGVGGSVLVRREIVAGANIRLRGEDVHAGDMVLEAGEVLGPAAVGLAAATGSPLVAVCRRPHVAVLATGDELVGIDERPGPGAIRDSNSHALAAQVAAAGGVPVRIGVVRDSAEQVRAALDAAATAADVIVSSGGVSVGDRDFVRDVLAEHGSVTFWRVAMRPGSPQTFGIYRDVPFFGLPGNPTSAAVGFELFVRPALRLMQGFEALDRPRVVARLAHPLSKRPGRPHYLRGVLTRASADAGYEVASAGSQSSALLTTMHRANCLMLIGAEVASLDAGAQVTCMRLDAEEGTP